MEWKVYMENINKRTIEPVNILRCSYDKIKNLKKKSKGSFDCFERLLRGEMMNRYWSRCEYEVLMYLTDENRIVLRPWIGSRKENICLDVTEDKNFDWKDFARKCDKSRDDIKSGVKIDVYDQLQYKWEDFCKYCWDLGEV